MKIRSQVGDIVLALFLTAFGIAGTFAAGNWSAHGGGGPARFASFGEPPDRLAFALVIGCALVLAVRRRWPLVTLGVTTVLTATYLAFNYVYGPILVFFVISVYTVARYRPFARSVPAALASLAILSLHIFVRPGLPDSLYGLIPASGWIVVPFAVGFAVRQWQESVARDRAETLRQHVDDERLLVAQEVHDIVGHGLAAIKMQADVALHLLAKKPEQAEQALEAISRTSSEALEELRSTLAVVRRTESRSPTPTLARLPDLRQRMAEAGVVVDLVTVGPERTLPTVVDLTAYRIVQESLTNVLRHSGAAEASVVLRYEEEKLDVTVVNPVNGPSDTGSGLGIPGMRHRVIALAGQFAAGPTGDGRFEVHASLPTGGDT
jgi:signal transduction histidine kinase